MGDLLRNLLFFGNLQWKISMLWLSTIKAIFLQKSFTSRHIKQLSIFHFPHLLIRVLAKGFYECNYPILLFLLLLTN